MSRHSGIGGFGAGDGARTRDILLGKQTLCQLSYSRSGEGAILAGQVACLNHGERAVVIQFELQVALGMGREPAFATLQQLLDLGRADPVVLLVSDTRSSAVRGRSPSTAH